MGSSDVPIHFDDKQRKIITSWFRRASELKTKDPYASFMSLWIAFNAFCFGLFAKNANKRRADLDEDKGLLSITEAPSRAEGVALLKERRFKLKLDKPGKISIVISERYTEDIIFSEFAKRYQSVYEKLFRDPKFEKFVKGFQESLKKEDGRSYVINMVRINEYDLKRDYDEMSRKNIIVPFENRQNLAELKDALYQVRSNMFHGEKVPGNPNDDRIVKTAYPVLFAIMQSLIAEIQVVV